MTDKPRKRNDGLTAVILIFNVLLWTLPSDLSSLLMEICAASVFVTMFAWLFFTLHRLVGAIDPDQRELSPPSVWFCVIPVVGQIWIFMMAGRIARSLKNQFTIRGYDSTGQKFGLKLGQNWSLMSSTSIISALTATLLLQTVAFPKGILPGAAIGILLMIPVTTGMFSCWFAYSYYHIMHEYLRYLNDEQIAYRTADERDFDDGYKSGPDA